MSSCSDTLCTSLQRRFSTQVSYPGVTLDVLQDAGIVQIETANRKYRLTQTHLFWKNISHILQTSFYACIWRNFRWFEKKHIWQNLRWKPFFSHWRVTWYIYQQELAPPGHDGAGAARTPIASHYASRFWSTALLWNHLPEITQTRSLPRKGVRLSVIVW